tara:strand:+ start:983 stop:1324 length:342 start_codon:yes stop_codon:yes gene_type:complete
MDKRYSLGSVKVEDGTPFKPIGDLVAIKPTPRKTETEEGIIYNEKEHDRFADGIVISIAEGIQDENGNYYPVDFKEGDRVLHDKHAGFHNVGDIILTRRQHIVAVIGDDVEIK